MRGYRDSRNPWIMVAMILIGAILGSVVGASFSHTLPILKNSQAIGFPATTFNLIVAQLTLGFKLNFNLGAVAGAVLGWLVYRRM